MYNNNNHVDGNESTPDRCAQLLSFTIQSHPVAHSEFLRFSYIKTIPKVDLYLIFWLINWFLLTEIERKFGDFLFVFSFWIEISLWLDQQSGLTIFSMLRITESAGHARPYLFWRSECAVGCCRLPVYLCAWPIMRSAFSAFVPLYAISHFVSTTPDRAELLPRYLTFSSGVLKKSNCFLLLSTWTNKKSWIIRSNRISATFLLLLLLLLLLSKSIWMVNFGASG